jgi:twitching motility protein PilT
MSVLPSLMRVISSVDGECLVLQTGETPYVFSGGNQIPLAAQRLSSRAVWRIIERVLPQASRRALEERGVVQYEFDLADLPGDRFSVVAARAGDEAWMEIRRRALGPEDEPSTQVMPGLSREIQRLATEREGLILVLGTSARDESSLVSALVDLITRARHVRIARIEGERTAAPGGTGALLEATCAALADNPDVLVLDCRLDAPLATVALDSAASGRLVICTTADLSASAAVETLVDLFPPDDHRVVSHALAHVLRGVVGQAASQFPL